MLLGLALVIFTGGAVWKTILHGTAWACRDDWCGKRWHYTRDRRTNRLVHRQGPF